MTDDLGCGRTYRKDDGTTAECTAMAPCPACVAHYAALDQPVPPCLARVRLLTRTLFR